MKRAMVWFGLFVAVAYGGLTAPTRVNFMDGKQYNLLTGTSSACTTQFYLMRESGRYPSVGYGAYVASAGSAGDSAHFSVQFQWSYDSKLWDSRRDTIAAVRAGDPGDSLVSGMRWWIDEYYPRVSRFQRIIFTTLAGNGDSIYIGNVQYLGDDGK
jgi:hypothetical protein